MAKGTWVMRTAVVVSILAHASLIGAAGLRKPAATAVEPPPPADVWAGTTALPTFGDEVLQDVEVVGSSAGESAPVAPPAVPATSPEQDSVPVDPPKVKPIVEDKPVHKDKPVEDPTPKPAAPKAPAKPKPVAHVPDKDESSEEKSRPAQAEAPADPLPKDKPEEKDTGSDERTADQDKPVDQDKPTPEPEKKPARPATKSRKPVATAAATAASSTETPAADAPGKSPSGSFGAEGTASVRDLGRAFTRALPPACDSDATWGKLAAGSAGSLDVAVLIDADGKINGFEPISKNPPSHLISAMKRTLALLRGGVFALQGGSVTAGRQVLRLSVELSDTTVSEEEAAGASAFGLASKWEGKKGVASFTQPSGRHVEISVEFVRVEPLPE